MNICRLCSEASEGQPGWERSSKDCVSKELFIDDLRVAGRGTADPEKFSSGEEFQFSLFYFFLREF